MTHLDVDNLHDLNGEITLLPVQHLPITCSVKELVRYMHQQDHGVFSDKNGGFLVNGKFHLELPELVAMANRIRRRQKKPPFEL
jgi:hypothetical protein